MAIQSFGEEQVDYSFGAGLEFLDQNKEILTDCASARVVLEAHDSKRHRTVSSVMKHRTG